ncbi:MAG: hypothetical protein B7Z75_13100 [Acidocella sp. 20-57-95]|nr:MAG: hypothetical protein B7Z75_13100 [Acidocella sp. 20-57-95]OYV60034.1 MAG: hypothetical protein B7Z71_06910 [Acidocella sp. 21-58-7]HQT65580.1 DUF1345 domain-containing protein [Acidocella sp.]HQU03467.1 DUF1345 domain-containing protein [Acidocella sp.]
MLKFRLLRIITARPRLFTGYGLGLLSFFILTPVNPLAIRGVLAWDIGSAVFLLLTAQLFIRADHTDISYQAARQQEGEWSVFALTLIGAVMSFAAIFLFSDSAMNHKAHTSAYLAFVITTLILSWATTHVSFAYRYTHEYYSVDRGQPPGKFERGVVFPGEENPDYLDFIYFSFVLGMTFQVSDVNITSKKLRRLATLQGLIGFLFNTVILALSVNIAASLL